MQGNRGRPAVLSREKIVETARLLIKEQGVEGITMRRVADALNSAPMSLYSHVKNKEDLLEAVLGSVLGQIDITVDPEASWQQQLIDWAQSLREQLNRHPEIMPLFSQKGRFSKSFLAAVDLLIDILQKAGFDGEAILTNCRLINWMVFGFVLIETTSPAPLNEVSKTEAGAINTDLLQEMLGRETPTSVTRLVYKETDQLFAYQVDLMVKGLEQVLAAS